MLFLQVPVNLPDASDESFSIQLLVSFLLICLLAIAGFARFFFKDREELKKAHADCDEDRRRMWRVLASQSGTSEEELRKQFS